MHGWLTQTLAATTSFLILLLTLGGCYAGINAYPASAKRSDGIRYYLPAPYLVVERTGSGDQAVWDANFETIADSSRPFLLQPYAYFAKQEATIELNSDGTLKSVVLTHDSTPVSTAVVEAVKEVWVKKLELDKAAADAERIAATRDVRDQSTQKRIWVLRIKGATLESTDAGIVELTFPRPKIGPFDSSGKIEGTFSIPVGGSKIETGTTKNQR